MAKLLIGKTQYFSVWHAHFCRIAGYLIIEPLFPVQSLWMMPDAAQAKLGRLQADCARAIQDVVAPLRIYQLVFAEENPTYHCHIFPRSTHATAAYLNEFPDRQPPIHGPLFFEWAREFYSGDASEDVNIRSVMARLCPLIGLSAE